MTVNVQNRAALAALSLTFTLALAPSPARAYFFSLYTPPTVTKLARTRRYLTPGSRLGFQIDFEVVVPNT